jgi:CheY-like chemotaxis protein
MTAPDEKIENSVDGEERPAGFDALVVEDETLVAWHLEELLYELGMEACVIVSSGREAVVRALGNRPSVVFMDVNLAGELDGVEAARQILEKTDVPIIFVTAYADDAATVTRIRSALGDTPILGKPANRAGVQAALRRAEVI